jgi:hypothetical protein
MSGLDFDWKPFVLTGLANDMTDLLHIIDAPITYAHTDKRYRFSCETVTVLLNTVSSMSAFSLKFKQFIEQVTSQNHPWMFI